jgi:hypothetical protein
MLHDIVLGCGSCLFCLACFLSTLGFAALQLPSHRVESISWREKFSQGLLTAWKSSPQ